MRGSEVEGMCLCGSAQEKLEVREKCAYEMRIVEEGECEVAVQ